MGSITRNNVETIINSINTAYNKELTLHRNGGILNIVKSNKRSGNDSSEVIFQGNIKDCFNFIVGFERALK